MKKKKLFKKVLAYFITMTMVVGLTGGFVVNKKVDVAAATGYKDLVIGTTTGIIDNNDDLYFFNYDEDDERYETWKCMSSVESVSACNQTYYILKKNGDCYEQFGPWSDWEAEKLFDNVKMCACSERYCTIIKNNGDLYYKITDASGDDTFRKIASNVKSVKSSCYIIAFLSEDNKLYTFGDNRCAQIGDGNIDDEHHSEYHIYSSNPYKVLENVVDYSVTTTKISAIKENGDLYFWGNSDTKSPEKIVSNAKRVAVNGVDDVTYIKTDGNLYKYGWRDYEYEDGYEIFNYHKSEKKILDNVKGIYNGVDRGTLGAITTNNELYCWGENIDGVVGYGEAESEHDEWAIYNPKKVLDNVKKVCFTNNAGFWEGAGAITNDNKVYRWGDNSFCQVTDDPSKMKKSYTDSYCCPSPVLVNADGLIAGTYTSYKDGNGGGSSEEGGGSSSEEGGGGSGGGGGGSDSNTSNSKIKIGQKVEFQVPKSVPIIGGGKVELDFDNIPIQFEKEGNTYRLGIGTKNLADNKDRWCDFKKFVETQNEDLRKGLNSLLASKFGIASMAWSVKPEIRCYGFLEGTIKNNKIQSSEGKMVIEMKVKAKKEWQVMVVVVPVVIKASGEVGVKASLGVGLDFEHSKCYMKGSCELTLPKIKLSAGVGVAYIADISVYGSATNEIKLESSTNSDPSVTAALTGEMGVSAKLLCIEYSKTLLKGTVQYYSSNGKKASTRSFADNTKSLITDGDDYTIDRHSQSNWKSESDGLKNEKNVAIENVYDDARPQLVKTSSGKKVLIYTADISSRSKGNHTAIVYSVYDEGADQWSSPKIIDDDGTADYYPSIAVDGEKVYVSWSNSKSKVQGAGDEDFLENASSKLDIELATINISNNQITTKSLSNDDYLDYKSSVAVVDGKAYVGWVKNQNNDMMNMSGENQIYLANVSSNSSKMYTDGLNQVSSLALGNLEDELCIAYTEDEDGDISTTDDALLNEGDLDGNIDNVENGILSNVKFANVLGTDRMLYCSKDDESGERIMSTDQWGYGAEVLAEGIHCSPDYSYIVGNNKEGLLICSDDKTDEDGSDVYAYSITEDGFKEAVTMTNNVGYSSSLSGVKENGKYIIAYTKTKVDMEGDSVDESSDIYVSTISPSRYLELDDVSYDPEDVQLGEDMDFTVKVKNNGLLNDNGYTIKILSGSNVIGEQVINDTLEVGEEREENVTVTIPNSFKKDTSLTFKVYSSDGKVVSEGSLSEKVGKTDLQLNVEERDNDVKVDVDNTTPFGCSAELLIKDTDADGKVYKKIDLGYLGDNGHYSTTINKDELNDFEKGDVNLFFEVVTDEEELYKSNNTGFVFLPCSHSHLRTEINKASYKKEGSYKVTCEDCGTVISKKTIPAIKKTILYADKFTYTGDYIKPILKVKDTYGDIVSPSNYTVSYKNNLNVGIATVIVTFRGDYYTGSLIRNFTIGPKGTSIASIKAKKKALKVKWRITGGIDGYTVQCSRYSSFSGAKTKTVRNPWKSSIKFKKLKRKKKYYVRIRTFKAAGGITYKSAWSAKKKKKTK